MKGGAQKRSSLQEYRGKLSPKQIADGMCAALRNARRLVDDATLLFEAKRYSTALALAILAIEEAGKVSILRGFAMIDDVSELRGQWTRYRDHRSKNGAWIILEKAKSGAKTLNDLADVVDPKADHTQLINSIKQLALYTGCYGNAHWAEPDKIFDDDKLASVLIETARLLTTKDDPTEREIKIWIKHMKPVWKTSGMSAAIVRFHTELYQEGLSSSTPEDVVKFIFGEDGLKK
jgi:AbiV family abortive infection protein